MATGVTRRLDARDKFNEPRTNSALINSTIKAAEKMELDIPVSIGDEVKWEKQRRTIVDGMDSDTERYIRKRREEQYKEFLKLLANAQANQVSKLEAPVSEKFKFASNIQIARKETESLLDWLPQHTAEQLTR